MTTWKQLSASLRLTIAAPWCLLVALLCAGAAGMIDVKTDPTSHEPINTTVSLSGTHWTGTLDDARLSANVPLLSSGDLNLPGPLSFDGYLSGSDGSGNLYLGNSIYLGDSTEGAALNGPSGATLQDAGSAAWLSAGALRTGGSVTVGFSGEQDVYGGSFNSPTGSYWLDDGNGGWKTEGQTHFDVHGNAQIGNQLSVTGTTQLDNGAISTDGYGGMTAYDLMVGGGGLNASGDLSTSGIIFGQALATTQGITLWNQGTTYVSQPPIPADLTGVINLLRGYGFCQ